MTFDNDWHLSAYLDGQLSPDDEQSVESDLVADPQLAEKLRSLTSLRDLVAELSRDAPIDVTPQVMHRIRRRIRFRSILARRAWAVWPAWRRAGADVLLGSAAAALIAICMTFAFRLLPTPEPADKNPQLSVAAGAERFADPRFRAPRAQEPSFPSQVFGAAAAPDRGFGGQRTSQSRQAFERTPPSRDIELVHQFLDNPRLRHILLVTDPDGSTEQKVASVVEQTTRFNYCKITISQGIVIDPRHPEQATVFALVVEPGSLDSLRSRLCEALKGRVEEAPVDAAVATQLADIGEVQSFQPTPAGDVLIPRHGELSLRQDADGFEDGFATLQDRPTPEQERSSPAAEFTQPAAGRAQRGEPPIALAGAEGHTPKDRAPTGGGGLPGLAVRKADEHPSGRSPVPPERADENVVVLVWVSRTRAS
jgi:hypothetical protein